ncbi:hypothetical protein K438DRAFT_2168356 [Mycena galopus ATCC 62051]|nr:hypothetical protein K438DRAFT_2168356 [Mycena galopus ATCC 62051]
MPPARWDLTDINLANVRIERDNKTSIAFTKASKARGFPGGVGALDVGTNLKPFYEYPEEFKELLVKAPLPAHQKTRRLSPTRRMRATPNIQELFANQPHSIPKTDIGENGVTVIDMVKAEHLLSTDDFNALTPGLWCQASVNQLCAFKNICAASVPGNLTSLATLYAVEYRKYILFFTTLHYFKEIEMFEVWFRLEAALCTKVFNNGIFNTSVWKTKWGIAASTHKQLRHLGMIFTPSCSASLFPAGPSGTSKKHVATDDANPNSSKKQNYD